MSAAGLPDLLCHSSEEYVARAIELGRDRTKLAEYRARLLHARATCVLFATALLTSRLEQLFRDMWDEAVAGRMKRPNLANLDIYREIGAELDRDDREMGTVTVTTYRELYLAALADRHSFDTIAEDERLWNGLSRKQKSLGGQAGSANLLPDMELLDSAANCERLA